MKNSLRYFLAIAVFAIMGCSKKEEDAFRIQGTMAGAGNEKVVIETLSFPNINGSPLAIVIDTVTADADGNFEVKNFLLHPSILRIKLDSDPSYYFLLSIQNEDVTVKADRNATGMPTVSGSASTASFYSFINTLRAMNTEIIDKRNRINAVRSNGQDSLANVQEEEMNAQIEKYYDFIAQYADTVASVANKAIALESLSFATHYAVVKDIADKLFLSDTVSVYARELLSKTSRYQSFLDAAKTNSFVGSQAPDITLRGPDGKSYTLSSLKGNVVLLDFWASWCGPCRQENPNLVNVYKKYKEQGYTVYSVSLDSDRKAWIDAIAKDKLEWPYHVSELDGGNSLASAIYNITAIPTSFLIDRNGVIVAENLRGPALEEKVKEVLQSGS